MEAPSYVVVVVLLLFAAFQSVANGNSYPANDYEHSFNRDALIEAERKFEHRDTTLTKDEETVDHFLQYLKWREFKVTKDGRGFPPSRPIEEQLDYIQSTDIYKALIKFPKGGNMHSHENHDTSKRFILDIVWDSPDFPYLYMLPPTHATSPWKLDFFVNPPDADWIKVQGSSYTKDQILQHQTLLGILSANATRYPTDSGMRWKEMNVLWDRASTQLIANINVKSRYLQKMYEVGWSQGIIYFETRKNLGMFERIYELDHSGNSSATNGKRFFDADGQSGDKDIEITVEAARNFSETHAEFVGHRRISYTFRQNPMSTFDYEMENVARLHLKHPDHVIGFDAVGEEDAGYSHLHYVDEFIKLYDSTSGQPRVPLYLHTSETNWPDDLIASNLDDDLVATLMNSYETLLLNSKRIGHGYGFAKHPYLLEIVRSRNLAVETCIISNQLLGFTPDVRNHPSLHHFRFGIPIILGSDDAGTFGYDNITVDWYSAFMSWGLDLNDLRTLAINSLNYSGLSSAEKQEAINVKWKSLWNNYTAETKAVACGWDYAGDAASENRSVSFGGILPKSGAKSGTTKVHVFGRNFEVGICRNVSCQFGNKTSPSAKYISNQHIVCQSPDFGDQQVRTVSVSVSLDGVNFRSTGFNFTYEHDLITTTTTTPTTTPAPPASGAVVVRPGTGAAAVVTSLCLCLCAALLV